MKTEKVMKTEKDVKRKSITLDNEIYTKISIISAYKNISKKEVLDSILTDYFKKNPKIVDDITNTFQ